VTPEIAKNLAVEFRRGALIGDVVKGGPAERAGIKKNDIVIAFQGKEITSAAMLRNEISLSPIGKDLRMVIVRAGKRQEVTVRIGDPKDTTRALTATIRERLGADVRSMTRKEAENYRLNVNEGVVITSLEQNGPLGRVGFEVGDIILEINGQSVGGLDNFSQMIASLGPNQRITLLAFDHGSGNSGYVTVRSR
jgi:serine protease Do